MIVKIKLLRFLLFLGFLVNSTFSLAQRVYDNASGDNEWRNSANWQNGNFVNTDSRISFAAGGNITVTGGNVRCSQMIFPDAGPIAYTFSGSQITLNGRYGTQPIQINKIGQSVTFNNPFVWNATGDAQNGTRVWKFIKKQSVLTFNNSLKLNSAAGFTVEANNIEPNQTQLNFNHSLIGTGPIKFGNKSRPIFGANYGGASYNGVMEIGGGAGNNGVILTSNVANPKTFLKDGGVINVTSQGASIIINGANTYKGNINVNDNTVALDFQKNQPNAGKISMGSGTINLSGATAVTTVAFKAQDNTWGTGSLAITGFADNEVSFGTDANGLTAQQLSQITLNGSAVTINNQGQLSAVGGGGGGGGGGGDPCDAATTGTFNNATNNGLWSDAGNWVGGVIPDGVKHKAEIKASSLIIDGNYHLAQLKVPSDAPANISITQTGGSNLTLVGKAVNAALQTNKSGLNLNIDADIIMKSNANDGSCSHTGGEKTFQFNSQNLNITFAAGKSLELATNLVVEAQHSSSKINFNGELKNNKPFYFAGSLVANFGSSYSGLNHTGGGKLIFKGPQNLVSNVADNGTFLNANKDIQIQGSGGSLTINGANTLKGDILVNGANIFNLVINKNQPNIEKITMASGGLNLSAAPGVTSIVFADNSSQDWGTGTLAITGVADNEVSFGTDADGLTTDQLAQITINGCTEVTINENGQLSATGGCPDPVEGNKAPSPGVDYVTVVKNKYSDPIEVLKNDSDEDGDEISLVSASSNQSNGIIDVNVNKGTIAYIPAPEFTGSQTIFYTITDGTDQSLGVLYVTVEENTIPVANPMSVSTTQEISVDIDLSGSDVNSDSLFYTLVDNPSNGVVSVSGDGKTIYTPNSGFFGSDSFSFKVNDGMDDSSTASVTINVTSNDTDNDGVLNVDDICPDTVAGTAVDITGCPVFKLPNNNNKIEITSASCVGSNDGSLKFSVTDSSFDYTVRLIGLRSQNQGISNHEINGASNSLLVSGLSEGLYSACFLVNGQPGYEQCFEVLIEQPQPLSAFIGINESSLTTNIELDGSDSYNIEVNGTKHDVRGNNFTAALRTGINNIKVSTDKNCQGLVEKQVFLSEEIQYYPNPTINDVNVHVSGKDKKVKVSVYSIKGELIYSREQEIEDFSRLTEIDLESQITGTYMVTLESETVRKVFKIVKE